VLATYFAPPEEAWACAEGSAGAEVIADTAIPAAASAVAEARSVLVFVERVRRRRAVVVISKGPKRGIAGERSGRVRPRVRGAS
jgi:hypothetical protein